MALVDERAVMIALRQRFLTLGGSLPATIAYEGHSLSASGSALSIQERFNPDHEDSIAFGISQAVGSIVYEVFAPSTRKDLIETAWTLANQVKGLFEHGSHITGSNGAVATVIHSYIAQTGNRTNEGSIFYVVPAIIRWRSFATLS